MVLEGKSRVTNEQIYQFSNDFKTLKRCPVVNLVVLEFGPT